MKNFAPILAAFGILASTIEAQVMNAYRTLPYPKTVSVRASKSSAGDQILIALDDVKVEGANWIRAFFDQENSKISRGTIVKISNEEASQTMTAEDLKTWMFSTAYFNGDSVKVEIMPAADSFEGADDFLVVKEVQVDDLSRANSICNQHDMRELSFSPRDARMFPTGCSVWLINDKNKCFLTAGHCYYGARDLIQFNVPLSDSRTGAVRQPLPKDQYPMDAKSIQYEQGTGTDWMYFGTLPNSAHRTAYSAQKSFYDLMPVDKLDSIELGDVLNITGYGTAKGDRNQVQKVHNGTVFDLHPRNKHALGYRVDTTPGNSGSAILHQSGYAVGIHTLGGCYWSDGMTGYNAGTRLSSPNLVKALKNPKGVCA